MNLLNPPVFLSEVSSDTSNKLSGAAEEAESDNMKTYLLSIETLTLLMIQRELRRVTLDTMSRCIQSDRQSDFQPTGAGCQWLQISF